MGPTDVVVANRTKTYYAHPMGILHDMREPYSAAESWFYDRFIAPGGTRLVQRLQYGLPTSLPDGARILDVGCGGGQNARLIAERFPGAHVTGLDLSAEQIARAERRASPQADRFRWLVGDATAMDRAGVADDRFDLVYSIASIKHWPEPDRGVAEMVRVAKPGAPILVVEADRACSLEDATAFVEAIGVPRLLLPIALAGFRTWVAGRSLTVHEARALWSDLPVSAAKVELIPGLPLFMMSATAGSS